MAEKFNAYQVRTGKQKLDSEIEKRLMQILMDFAESVDPHGCDDGDYDEAMSALLKMLADK